jgi:uncharacterized protein YifN (PemK superfamily)
MTFTVGDVMRLEYKWPHQAKKDDGSKQRPSVVFQDLGGKYFASPMSTVPPDSKNEAYAIPISAALQRQLGISDTKPSWIYANHANLVEMPNPAVHKARQDSWSHGRVPSGLLENMKKKRDAAIAASQMHLATIKKDPALEKYRAATVNPRHMPGNPGNKDARLEAVRARATALVKQSAGPTEVKKTSTRKTLGISR